MRKTDLTGAKLVNATLTGAMFNDAILVNTNLAGAFFAGAGFQGADLSYSTFGQVMGDKDKNHFVTASIKGVNFLGAKFNETNLAGQDLNGVVMANVDLRTAKLKAVYIINDKLVEKSVNLDGVVYNENTLFPDGFQPKHAAEKQ